MRSRAIVYAGVCAALGGVAALAAPVDHAQGGEIAARILGDRVLIRANLRTSVFQKDTYLVVDYAAETALAVHENVIAGIRFAEGEETLEVAADGFRLAIPQAGMGVDRSGVLTELTARYDSALDNVDVAAIVGAPALRQYAFSFDPAAGRLTLRQAREATAQDALQRESMVGELRSVGGVAYLPIVYGDGRSAWLAFGTAGYHSFVNAAIADRPAEPDGGVSDIRFAGAQGLPLSGMAALFPRAFEPPARPVATEGEEEPEPPPDPAAELGAPVLVRSGMSLWAGYRVEINPARGYFALTAQVETNYSQADADYYRAAALRDAEELRAYAARWPEDRNRTEAAGLLFEIGLEQGFEVAAQLDAVRLGLDATDERRRLDYVSDFVFPLAGGEDKDAHTALIIALCEEALKHVGRSERPRVRQHLQLVLGDRQLRAGDARGAWKTFLSASFNGDPRLEGISRHELGRAYEALGRHRRAYASYQRVRSPLVGAPPDMKENAKAGMARLRPLLAPDDPLLAEEAEDAGDG